MIYLDEAATTKPKQEVIEAMMPYLTEQFYNPSALYSGANKVKKDIENAKKTIGDFINADSNDIYFTSGGSEANCWAIQGFINYCNRKGIEPTIITSVIEHKSILSCVDNMNIDVHYIGVDHKGFIDMVALENVLEYVTCNNKYSKTLVTIQHANNEIGTIQRVKDIANIVHKYNAVFHTDAVQSFGHVPIDVKELDVDMMSASGHKISAPKGIGFLYKKNEIKIDPLVYGSQMNGLRGGTENVPYIMGMSRAVELVENVTKYQFRMNFLRSHFIEQLELLGCKINGSLIERLYNNINVTFDQNIIGESLVYLLDMSEIMVSTGSACNSKSIEPSYVLKAIGLSDEDAAKTIRITLPDNITTDKIDKVISELKKQMMLLTID